MWRPSCQRGRKRGVWTKWNKRPPLPTCHFSVSKTCNQATDNLPPGAPGSQTPRHRHPVGAPRVTSGNELKASDYKLPSVELRGGSATTVCALSTSHQLTDSQKSCTTTNLQLVPLRSLPDPTLLSTAMLEILRRHFFSLTVANGEGVKIIFIIEWRGIHSRKSGHNRWRSSLFIDNVKCSIPAAPLSV